MRIRGWVLTLGITGGLALMGCGGGDNQQPESAPAAAASSTPQTGTNLTPDAGGKVILVEMETDAAGVNKFEPADFEAKRGDVIRYTLISGVHNAHFVADSNPGKTGLPPAGPLLQLPHQTYDVKVTWEPGRYYYHCDPHALLGMVGHVTVTP
jgi:plastocyanin